MATFRGWRGVAAVIVITLVAIYVVKLAGLALAARQAGRIEARLATEVAVTRAEIAALETAGAVAGSPEAVEAWARDYGRLARPGDHPIALVTAAPDTATPAPAETPAPSGWRRLLGWLGGG